MTVALVDFNTVVLPAGQVYQLVTSVGPLAGPFLYNILNMGPDAIYMRDTPDPAPGDPGSVTLPALAADNGVFVAEGTRGLRVMAGPSGAVISVRVAVPQYA